ncbi:MAG TPA: hypothetical protein PKW80_00640 [Bacteroidales bacterium]|nr:hypothetical protein [Bacteroidales bacterium]
MAKLYIFAIGGTGARVVKALTFLLASGVEINADEVVPILIDPDSSNGDLSRTVDVMNLYNNIREKIKQTFTLNTPERKVNGFFEKPIRDIFPGFPFKYRLNLTPSVGLAGNTFGNYIDYNTIGGNNRKLVSLLFSGNHTITNNKGSLEDQDLFNLNTAVGVKGNPQIGSVILNQFNTLSFNNDFAASFTNNDRIMFVSSIFGGTGAAGFPLLLKYLRNLNNPAIAGGVPNSALIASSKIAAITVLPYFNLKQGEIDGSTFIPKTKAALEYYKNNVGPSLETVYYIGQGQGLYQNNPGDNQQRNDAHFIELASALSIIDFMSIPNINFVLDGNDQRTTIYKEYGLSVDLLDGQSITFNELGAVTKSLIENPLCQYRLFLFYLQKIFEKIKIRQPWCQRGILIDEDFKNSDFVNHIKSFNKNFSDWFTEMEKNKPAFMPFNSDAGEENVFMLIKSIKGNSGYKRNFALFDDYLNAAERHTSRMPQEQKFISTFYLATKKITDKLLKTNKN